MATLDLGPKTCPESLFNRELDPVLVGEGARQGRTRNEPELDDGLTETTSRRRLLREGKLELILAQEALLDEEPAEGPPGEVGRFHGGDIGTSAAEIKCSQVTLQTS
jgi:hypothetical protein